MNHPRRRIFLNLVVTTIFIVFCYYTNDNELGQAQQDQDQGQMNTTETIVQQNERIIEQNDEEAIQERAGTWIGIIALLVSLSLVIYGFRLSRGEKITQKAKLHYRIIILSLLIPVFILIALSWVTIEEFLYPHYHIMVSLLLIPGVILLILMFRGAIIGEDMPAGLANTKT